MKIQLCASCAVLAVVLLAGSVPVRAQDASEDAGPAAAREQPAQRGFFGRMWDRMLGRGNPNTEQGQEFHEEIRARQAEQERAVEQRRAEKKAEQELRELEREQERERSKAEQQLRKPAPGKEGGGRPGRDPR